MSAYHFEADTGSITRWGATQAADILLRQVMGWLPIARGLPPYGPDTVEWTPQYAVAVARGMHSMQYAAALLIEFGFPLSVALAVLTGRMVDVLL